MQMGQLKVTFHPEKGTALHIYDDRYPQNVDLTDDSSDFFSFSYTCLTDDIAVGEKPECTPYVSRKGYYDVFSEHSNGFEATNSQLDVHLCGESFSNGIKLHLHTDNPNFSEFGINLPLAFMSKKGGNWMQQFLVSSPYTSQNGAYTFCMFTRPDGHHLLALVENAIAGFKIDYSSFICGHFILNVKYLSHFDRAYHSEFSAPHALTLYLLPVESFEEALDRAAEIYKVPACLYETSSCFIGQNTTIRVIGNCDRVDALSPSGKINPTIQIKDNIFSFSPNEYGIYQFTPYYNEESGMDCTIYAIDNWKEDYHRTSHSVVQWTDRICGKNEDGTDRFLPPGRIDNTNADHPDFNLCESQVWASSALRYMLLYGIDDHLAKDVKNLLSFVMEKNPALYLERLTIVPAEAYNTWRSTRIQEVFHGVTILIDAFRLFQEETYLEFAVSAMSAMMENNLMESGEIRRYDLSNPSFTEDYTTVTCMIIPVIDLANTLQDRNDSRCHFFKNCAEKIADFVVRRGLSFPTEGGVNPLVNTEMEDGSISCAALTALYAARFLKNKPSYLQFAEEVLKIHDAWSIYTPDARMYRSSLRWWETIWEGDFNGPNLCCGHAWSIWRGEAEFHYGLLQKDSKRLLDSYNAYMSCFSHADKDGNMYAIYQCEPFSGGGLDIHAENMDFSITKGFPKHTDNSLSRYVFERSYESWFRCTALLKFADSEEIILNGGRISANSEIVSFAPRFEIFYADGYHGILVLRSSHALTIVSPLPFSIEEGLSCGSNSFGVLVSPDTETGKIIILWK